MCMIEDADGCSLVLSDRSHKARKEHKCAECGRVIGIGEQYHVERLIFDNQASTHKTCAHCRVARDWLSGECGGWIYGGVEEDVREHVYGGGYGFTVGRLAVGMAWKWRTPKTGAMLPVPPCPPTTHELMAAK